jgi:hypothetical protein
MEFNINDKISFLNSEILKLKTEIARFDTRQVSDLAEVQSRSESLVQYAKKTSKKSIDDILGRRYPRWYVVDIPFSNGDIAPKTSSVEISARPFVCTQMQSLYFITDTDVSHYPSRTVRSVASDIDLPADGRNYPTTAYFATLATMLYQWNVQLEQDPTFTLDFLAYYFSEDPSALAVPIRYVGWSYPDFDFEIRNSNSGRRWTDDKVPSAAFHGASGNPLFLAHSGFVDAFDRIEVTAHPTPRPTDVSSINLDGIVKFVFFGYEIDTVENLSDIFGY